MPGKKPKVDRKACIAAIKSHVDSGKTVEQAIQTVVTQAVAGGRSVRSLWDWWKEAKKIKALKDGQSNLSGQGKK